MKKGYTETMPKGPNDPQGTPIWGAPPAPVGADSPKAGKTQRERDREERFLRDATKAVPWQKNFRIAGGNHHYDYICAEALYRGFRKRLLSDPDFEGRILDMVLDRLMAEMRPARPNPNVAEG